jgi:hypothetical protein
MTSAGEILDDQLFSVRFQAILPKHFNEQFCTFSFPSNGRPAENAMIWWDQCFHLLQFDASWS